jgi:hypothetical protein
VKGEKSEKGVKSKKTTYKLAACPARSGFLSKTGSKINFIYVPKRC